MKTLPVRTVFFLLAISHIVSCKKDNNTSSSSQNDIPETKPAIQTPQSVSINGNIGGFYQALPARYDSTTTKYPLLICLHGTGELGNGASDLAKVTNVAIPARIKSGKFPPAFTVNGKSYSFIVIAPQFKNWPSASDVNAVLDYSVAHYRIDTTRIYVTGLSMGGGATWDFAGTYASRAAAIVPICGASSPSDARAKTMANAHLAVWAFHNNDDGTVSSANSIGYVNKINGLHADPQARLTLWPSGGHNAWDKATDPSYKESNMNIYEWMLQYNRNAQ
jgi:predicted peptidase